MKRINPKLYKYLLSLMLLAAAQNSSAQQAEVIRTETELPAIATKSLKLAVADEKETDSSVIKANASNQKVQIRLGGARATTLSSDNKPLYVVDGKFVNSDRFKNFNPNSIKSIDILKASTAVALYGPSGVNGVIIIVTKKCEDSKKETVPTS